MILSMPAPATHDIAVTDARALVVAALRRVAPDCRTDELHSDQALADQVDLDSLDWLNVADILEQALGHALPAGSVAPAATLDGIVAAISAARRDVLAGSPPGSVEGRSFHLRPLTAADAELEAEFVRRLSDESRYMRFLTTLRELSPGKLDELTNVDQQRHLALAATTSEGDRERIAGVARCIADPDGRSGEFAITVADDWQHSGLAGVLMHALIDAARARGVTRIHGLVLATNHQMLAFARRLGFSVKPDEDAHLRRVELALA